MSTRVEGKDGNGYLFMTKQEAEGQEVEQLKFESPAHAQAFLDRLMLTPEGREQLYRLVEEVEKQKIIDP
jgi:hypothetical protein